jgi:6-phosphogluconate dehydrogenase
MIKGKFGIIGLGKMGGNLALHAIDKNYQVCGYDPNAGKELKNGTIQWVDRIEELADQLPSPRIIFIYIPAGDAVDKVLEQLSALLKKDDIIVDGGNSYWGDSIRRAENLMQSGIYFIDCGTSGGVDGARNGACFMAGGEEAAIQNVAPILKDLSVPGGYVHTGPVGSGHFVKLVHNGIEFGMLQAIGEGMDLLSHYQEDLNFPEILNCWNNGSVIRSWLIELMGKVYDENQGFSQVPSYIEDTGEVNWLINDALHMEVPVPVIAQSVMQLFASREQNQIWAKAIAMMRHGFGGHPFGEDQGIRHERESGRVGGFLKKKGQKPGDTDHAR